MAEGVMTAGLRSGAAHFSVSDTGALVYVTGGDPGERTLVWVDRDGREEALAAEPRAYRHPRISPDGGRVAVVVSDPEQDIWIWDFARETLTPLTFAPGEDFYPVWTPDGRQVAFASNRDGEFNLYWKATDGTGTVERLTESENQQAPYAFTPDGRQLLFGEIGEQGVNLGVLSLDGSSEPLLVTEFSKRNGEISPDGRWLAYESNASGQFEIYVRPFPNVEDGQWQIRAAGAPGLCGQATAVSCSIWPPAQN
jgi:serine/threonine-protein kinase